MFSLYYVVKNIIKEINAEGRAERAISKLYKQNDKLKICIQKYTYKFYNCELYSRVILLNHIFEIEFIVRSNVDLFYNPHASLEEINLLILKTKDKIKELKNEMRAM